MNVSIANSALATGRLEAPGLFPHLEELSKSPYIFPIDFGIASLPEEPGIILVRGARQYGKSTWLEDTLRHSVQTYGPATAFYLNGDELASARELTEAIRALTPAFASHAKVRRLFIDEVTAVQDWEHALKRLVDSGELRSVLVVTTGSKATDLRRGAERLPGRKGRLPRTDFLFTPISYSAFRSTCGSAVPEADALWTYILSGGSPAALSELASEGRLPEHRIEAVRDWIFGECAASGRSRASLLTVLERLAANGGSPVGQAKLAREAGLANNTVAAGYVELLADLLCIGQAQAWDAARSIRLARKPCKFHFINLLAAATWHPSRPRSADDLRRQPETTQSMFLEWIVAQELWRRRAKRGEDIPELLAYWRTDERELDFVVSPHEFIEVKRGTASPLEFAWFPRTFPKGRLTVINSSRFETDHARGVTLDDFLSEEP